MAIFEWPKIQSTFRKAIAFNSQPTEDSFPELPTVLIWLRFTLAAFYGGMLGYNGTRSALMLIHTVNLLAFVPVMYCRMYLRMSESAFPIQVVFSGLFQAIALTLLVWIYGFTAAHDAAVQQLSSLLLSAASSSSESGSNFTSETVATTTAVPEDEF